MLCNHTGYQKIVIITGYSDMRKGINGLAELIKYNYNMDPFELGTLYLFCGRSAGRIKGLQWENDGFAMVTKRLESGRYQWPRSKNEAINLTQEQFDWLMKGLSIVPSIREINRKLTI